MQTPVVGSKVRFIRENWYDGEPGLVLVGETGTVKSAQIEPNGENQPTILIKLDNAARHPHLIDGIYAFYPECGPQEPNGDEVDTLAQFWHHCEIVN